MKPIFCRVISTHTYKPIRTPFGAFNIQDTLECGNVQTIKGSRGFASRRKCINCTLLGGQQDGVKKNGA